MNGPNVLTQSHPDADEARARADQLLPAGNGNARKQTAGTADRLLKFTLSITQILAESPGMDAALERALRIAGETLGWDVGTVWLPDSEGKLLRCAQMWCSPNIECAQFRAASFGRGFTPGVGLPGRVWSAAKPAWIPDVTRDNNFLRGPMAAAEGLHSAFAFPILCGEKFLAVMEFFSGEIRKPDEQLLAVFQILGGQLGQMMERKGAEEKLRLRTGQLAAFLETAAVGLHRVGPNGIILWANDAELQSLGYAHEEYVGRHIAEFHADQDVIADILARLSRGERLCEYEARMKCKDGSLKTMLIDSSVLWENGLFIHTQCFTRDITERKEAEKRLRENERRFREMIDALPAAIYTTDAEGRVTHFNPAAVELSGRTPEIGSDQWCVSWKLYRPDGTPLPLDKCPMAIALKEGRAIRGEEIVAERPDGKRVYVTPYPTPLRDAEGRLVGGINMLVDITEQKQAEEALRRSQEQLEAELSDSRLLQSVSAEMMREADVEALYEKILDAAVTIMRADYASMQMLYPERGTGGELRLLAFRGFNPAAAKFWEWVRADSESTCGAALRTGQRVIAADVEKCDFMAGTEDLATYLQTGIHAVQTTPLFSRSGKMVGMISTHWRDSRQPSERDLRLLDILARQAADLIERKQAEAALRESEERFRKMADAVPVLIWVSDVTKGCTWFNQCWKDFSGRPLAELLGDGWAKDVHPDDLDRCLDIYTTCFDAREPFSMEYRLKRHDGEYRWVLDNGIPRFEAKAVFAGYIGACIDLTERKQAADALRKSEERYRSLVSVVSDVPWTTDADGAFVTPQEAYSRYTGKSWDELRGYGWTNCIHPEDRERLLPIWKNAVATRTTYDAPCREWHGPTKQWRYVIARGTPVLNPDGSVREWVGTLIDVHERVLAETTLRESEAALRASEEELKLVSNAVPALISYIDRDRRYRTCNYAYTDWFDVRREDIAGKPVREVLGEDAWAAIEPRINKALAGEKVEFEAEVNYRTVGRRWIHAVYTPHRDAQGDVAGIVVMVNDVTERKQADVALREAHSLLADKAKHLDSLVQERTAKLTETVTELEAFSYSVSHDLRSPLRAMQAYSSIIAESAGSKLSGQETDYLRRIERAALRLDRLTQDVLAYSRVARSEIALQPVDLEKLIRDVIDQYPQIQEHRAHIVVESPLLIVLANESFLGQCVSNLLANALKFVRPGETPKVRVWTEEAMLEEQPAAKLVVEDNGIGIAPEHAHRIFQMFGRVHPDKQYDGTGIGLTIVKKAVERMGGAVGYDSKVGKGSRFWMLLKRA